jgi:hypothetical protein
VKEDKCAAYVECMEEMNAYRVLVGNPERKRPLRSFRCSIGR